MLQTCLARVGGKFCHVVGDVVACIILSFMNDYNGLQKVGCDNVLGSDATEDSCGVCKGNNSDCAMHRGLYSKHHPTNREYL